MATSSRTAASAYAAPRRLGFWSLILTQFQGAFSDNALKNLVILLILDAGFSAAAKNGLVPLVLVLFSLPFILFSMAGGFLADRYSKRSVAIATKLFEVCTAAIALAGLWLGNWTLSLAAIFLYSTQGALFGPVKYGILPELLPERDLSWGNGVLELGTFLAILTGTIAAGYLSDYFRGRQAWSGGVLVLLALLGTLASLGISRVHAADPGRKPRVNFVSELRDAVSLMRRDHLLWQAVLGNTFFWFLGGLLQPIVILYGKETLHLSDAHNTWLQAALAIGIGFGSLAAGYFSGGKIEYGLVPLGALGMTAGSIWLSLGAPVFSRVLGRLALLGFFAGFFSVPVLALTQHRPSPRRRGEILAATNLLSFVGIFAAGGVYYLLISAAHFSSAEVFLTGAAMTLLCALYAFFFVEDCAMRMALWCVTRSVCWLHVEGRDALPEQGGVIFLCESAAPLDSAWLFAATDRKVQFCGMPSPAESGLFGFFGVTRAKPAQVNECQNWEALAEFLRAGNAVCYPAARPGTGAWGEAPAEESIRQVAERSGAPVVRVHINSGTAARRTLPLFSRVLVQFARR